MARTFPKYGEISWWAAPRARAIFYSANNVSRITTITPIVVATQIAANEPMVGSVGGAGLRLFPSVVKSCIQGRCTWAWRPA